MALGIAAPVAGNKFPILKTEYPLIVPAPVDARNSGVAERSEDNVYGLAHALKMEGDEYKKRDEDNVYGLAHALKMEGDEYKKRDEDNVYGLAHALKMEGDEYKA